MSPGTPKNQPRQKSGRAIAPPALPPPRSLNRRCSELKVTVLLGA